MCPFGIAGGNVCSQQLEKFEAMKHRFLLHLLSHSVIIVDITGFGTSTEGGGAIASPTKVPAFRFNAQTEAAQFLRARGADTDALDAMFSQLDDASTAVLTIADQLR